MLVLAAARRFQVLRATAVALALRVGYGFANYLLTRGQVGDAIGYDRDARELAGAWATAGQQIDLVAGKEGWIYILATVYRAVGHAPEVGIVLNALVGSATVVVVAATCQALAWDKARKPASWLMALWPVSVLWGPLLLREAIVAFLMALGMLGASLLVSRRVIPGFVLVAVSGVLMIWMRGGLAFLLLVGMPLVAAAAISLSSRSSGRIVKSIALAGVALAVALPALGSRFSGVNYFDAERTQIVARALDTGGTGFSSAGVSTGGAWQYVNTLVGPLPTSWVNPSLLFAGVDAALWIAIWTLSYIGYRNLETNRWAVLLAVVPTLAMLLFLGQSATNFGLIIRLRGLAIPLMAPLVGYGIATVLERRKARRHLRRRVSGMPNTRGAQMRV